MKMRTKAQEWANKRNWSKLLLSSIFGHTKGGIFRETLTDKELNQVLIIQKHALELLDNWDQNNPESKKEFIERR